MKMAQKCTHTNKYLKIKSYTLCAKMHSFFKSLGLMVLLQLFCFLFLPKRWNKYPSKMTLGLFHSIFLLGVFPFFVFMYHTAKRKFAEICSRQHNFFIHCVAIWKKKIYLCSEHTVRWATKKQRKTFLSILLFWFISILFRLALQNVYVWVFVSQTNSLTEFSRVPNIKTPLYILHIKQNVFRCPVQFFILLRFSFPFKYIKCSAAIEKKVNSNIARIFSDFNLHKTLTAVVLLRCSGLVQLLPPRYIYVSLASLTQR